MRDSEGDYHDPYATWCRTLRDGGCRIPPVVTPAIMRDVMMAFAESSTGDAGLAALVCNACGMFLPRDFGPCPICGGDRKDRNWPWLAGAQHGTVAAARPAPDCGEGGGGLRLPIPPPPS
jgi:hypothetical protein